MKTYKLIIIDFDGTLYDIDDILKDVYKMQINFFSKERGISKEETASIFYQNGIFPYKSVKAKSATEFFLKSGLNVEKWRAYREFNYHPNMIKKEHAVHKEVLLDLAKSYRVVLLSTNTYNNILITLKWLDIDIDIFYDIFCVTKHPGEGSFNKKDVIREILNQYDLNAGEVLSIGDRYAIDIKPLIDLGGDGILVSGPKAFERACYEIHQGKLNAFKKRNCYFYE